MKQEGHLRVQTKLHSSSRGCLVGCTVGGNPQPQLCDTVKRNPTSTGPSLGQVSPVGALRLSLKLNHLHPQNRPAELRVVNKELRGGEGSGEEVKGWSCCPIVLWPSGHCQFLLLKHLFSLETGHAESAEKPTFLMHPLWRQSFQVFRTNQTRIPGSKDPATMS